MKNLLLDNVCLRCKNNARMGRVYNIRKYAAFSEYQKLDALAATSQSLLFLVRVCIALHMANSHLSHLCRDNSSRMYCSLPTLHNNSPCTAQL